MYILAVIEWAVPPEREYQWLAGRLGLTAYDVRMRIGGKPPVVIRTAAERSSLEPFADELEARGHSAVVFDGDEFEKWRGRLSEPRRFVLCENALSLPAEEANIPYKKIAVLMLALLKRTTVTTKVEKKKKLAVGRAIATAGIVARKTVEKEYRRASEDRERVLYVLCGPPLLCCRLREHRLQYHGLGELLLPSQAENFSTLAHLLRQRAPNALFQDRTTGPVRLQTVSISGWHRSSREEYSNLMENDLNAFLLLHGAVRKASRQG
ncbi:MAG: hypothetical protein D6806_15040 [Deltaproteobacteria bacterium]|nr:MAG: hypothetical protein D6806_15040 [Deltaproteobacteria bacterium]